MLAELIVVFIALVIIGLSLYYLIRLSNVKTPPKDVKSTKEPASVGATGTASTPADVPGAPGPAGPAGTSSTPAPVAPPRNPDYQGGDTSRTSAPNEPIFGSDEWRAAADARLRVRNAAELATLPPCVVISKTEYGAGAGNPVERARMDRERANCDKRRSLGG